MPKEKGNRKKADKGRKRADKATKTAMKEGKRYKKVVVPANAAAPEHEAFVTDSEQEEGSNNDENEEEEEVDIRPQAKKRKFRKLQLHRPGRP